MKTNATDLTHPTVRDVVRHKAGNEEIIGGLTKREYFAVHILAGHRSNKPAFAQPQGLAEDAVKTADALIEALNRVSEPSGKT